MTKVNTSTQDSQGEVLLAKAVWYSVKRGRKRYYYPRIQIPTPIVEELRIDEDTEFEVWVEEREGEKLIVLRPKRKAVASAQPR
jgi:hypothetical protein